MSSKYNRFLLSTCLPVVAIVMLSYTPVYAGFEWTPPEKIESTPLPPVAPKAVISEKLKDKKTQIKSDAKIFQDMAKGQMMEGEIEAEPLPEEIIKEVPVENNSAEMTSENIIEEISIEISNDIIEIEPNNEVIEEIGEEIIIESEKKIISDEPSTFTLHPFPVDNDDNSVSDQNDSIIILPSDSDTDISDIVANDMNSNDNMESKEVIIWKDTEKFDVIEGFGTQMPLALALRQIVPVKYAFAFGKNVNPGVSISWKGGKPWNKVLEDALSPLNITYTINGNKLKLNKDITKDNSDISHSPMMEMPAEEAITEENNEQDITNNVIEVINDKTTEIQQEDTDLPSEIKEVEEVNVDESEILEIIEIEEKIIEEITPITETTTTKRDLILDPGKIEANQPIILENPKENNLLEEKKK